MRAVDTDALADRKFQNLGNDTYALGWNDAIDAIRENEPTLIDFDPYNTIHELKILPKYFWSVMSGTKNFELRKNDRPYRVGDELLLREYDEGKYTGNRVRRKIRYILKDCPEYGLAPGYCILGF